MTTISAGKLKKNIKKPGAENVVNSIDSKIPSSSHVQSRAIPIIGRRSYPTMGFRSGPTGGSYVAQRVLSAKVLRVKELQNELTETKNMMQELINENKLLKNLQKRQDTALAHYEDTTSALPRLLENHRAEVAAIKAHARAVRTTARSLHRKLQRTETELTLVRDQHNKLKQIASDRDLDSRSQLQAKVEELEDRLREMKEKNIQLNRKMELEQKCHSQQLQAEISKRKSLQKELNAALSEIAGFNGLIENRSNEENDEKYDLQSTSMSCLATDAGSGGFSVRKNQVVRRRNVLNSKTSQSLPKKSLPQLSLNASTSKTRLPLNRSLIKLDHSEYKPSKLNSEVPHRGIQKLPRAVSKKSSDESLEAQNSDLAQNILAGIAAIENDYFKDDDEINGDKIFHADISDATTENHIHHEKVEENYEDSKREENSNQEDSETEENPQTEIVNKNLEENLEENKIEERKEENQEKTAEVKEDKKSKNNEKIDKIYEWFEDPPASTNTSSENDLFDSGNKQKKTKNEAEKKSFTDSYANNDALFDINTFNAKLDAELLDLKDSKSNKLSAPKSVKKPTRIGRRTSKNDNAILSASQALKFNEYDLDINDSNCSFKNHSASSASSGQRQVRQSNTTRNNLIKLDDHLNDFTQQIESYETNRQNRTQKFSFGDTKDSNESETELDKEIKKLSMFNYKSKLDQLEQISSDYTASSTRISQSISKLSSDIDNLNEMEAKIVSKNRRTRDLSNQLDNNGDSDVDSDTSEKSNGDYHYSSDEAFKNKFEELKKMDNSLDLNHNKKNKVPTQQEFSFDSKKYLDQIDNSWKNINERLERDRQTANEKLHEYCRDVGEDVARSNAAIDRHEERLEITRLETEMIERTVKANVKINNQLKQGRIDSSKKHQLLAALKAIDNGSEFDLAENVIDNNPAESFRSNRSKQKIMKELFD